MESRWTDRTVLLLGEEKMRRLQEAHVLVVGVGGVGAYAAEMLCRAGVGEMTIVDADTVQPTNINRQLPATHSTIGSQVAAAYEYTLAVCVAVAACRAGAAYVDTALAGA